MKYQSDSKLQFDAKSDCYVFCILKIHEIVGKHEFSYRQLKAMRKVMVRADFIGQDGFINDKGISGIAAVASGITGHYVYIKRVTVNDSFNFLVSRFGRKLSSGKPVSHFVLMEVDTPAIVQWDPWSKAGARTTQIGQVMDYRYLFAEVI